DLKGVFSDLDVLDAPMSWSDVSKRRVEPPPPEPRFSRRILVAAAALAIAAAGIALVIRMFVLSSPSPPVVAVQPPAHLSLGAVIRVPAPGEVVAGEGFV